jgi:hypothetical protein
VIVKHAPRILGHDNLGLLKMKTLLLAIACLFVAQTCHATEALLAELGIYKRRVYVVQVTAKNLAGKPAWLGEQKNPPLSVRDAMSAARKELGTHFENASAWDLHQICLREITAGHWAYVVHFTPPIPPGGREGLPDFIKIIVLMDGTTPPLSIRQSTADSK